MRLLNVRLHNFRSYAEEDVVFHERLSTLVGENNTGKSSISLAITRALGGGCAGEDFPYGTLTDTEISVEFVLSEQDLEVLYMEPGFQAPGQPADPSYISWLQQLGNHLRFHLSQKPGATIWRLEFGQALFQPNAITVNRDVASQQLTNTEGPTLNNLVDAHANLGHLQARWVHLSVNVPAQVATFVSARLKRVDEFRTRAQAGGRSAAMETMTGADSASVLLNLKNHRRPDERARYRRILDTFSDLFPRYRVEAVEESPGSNIPSIQFIEENRTEPLSLSQLSAGVHQVLGFLVNLIGQDGLVIFIEHPEQHLHPHGMRFLLRIIRAAADDNQIVIVTHDPHFVSPEDVVGLRRVWWTYAGSRVHGAPAQLSDKQLGQMQTVLRGVGNREAVFARSVILVEDESQQLFLTNVAGTLGFDLDAHGVSVIAVGGHAAYEPFFAFIEALAIPTVSLRDKDWNYVTQPHDRYFSFGCELEQYLDEHGLAQARAETIADVGTAKPRVAAALAKKLSREQVPGVFAELLQAAFAQATGEPNSQVASG